MGGDSLLNCLTWSACADLSAPASAIVSSLGRIAGGFNDGAVRLWNPSEILKYSYDNHMNKEDRISSSANAVNVQESENKKIKIFTICNVYIICYV